MTKRILILLLILCLGALPVLSGCRKSGKQVLVIYNWGEYIANEADTYTLYDQEYEIKNVIQAFEAAYPQYEVKYLTYDDNEKMYPKLDKESFDIIVPSDYMVVRLIKEDKLLPLDWDKLPNVTRYLDPRLADLQYDADQAVSDKVKTYAVPYMYCTVGLIYNQDELGPIEGTSAQDVWQILFDPARQNRIGMYSSMRESIGVALNFLGFSLNTMNDAELEAAKQLLIAQRQTVRPIVGIDELKDKYVSGELVAGVVWSGDHVVCQQRLADDDLDPETLQYILPTGSNLSVDMLCIPKNANNPAGAMAFINFLYETEIALMNAVYVGYSSPHTGAVAGLPEEITGNRSYYPDDETIKSLEIYYSSEAIDVKYDQIWQTILAN